MVKYQASGKTYEGANTDEVARQVVADNIVRNKGKKHKPHPEDYNVVYNEITRAVTRSIRPAIREHQDGFKDAKKPVKRVTFKAALAGTRAIVNHAKGSVVTQGEMARRTNICSQCPIITKTTDCASCKAGRVITQTVNFMRQIAGRAVTYPNFRTVYGTRAKDHACGYCGCSMLTLIPAKMSAFKENEEDNQARPDMCWVKKGGINYVNTEE